LVTGDGAQPLIGPLKSVASIAHEVHADQVIAVNPRQVLT
jgi:hypothetical protein